MISDDDVTEPGEPTSARRSTGGIDDAAPDASSSGRAAGGAGGRGVLIVAAVAIVLAVAAGVVAMVQAGRAGDAADERDELAAAAADERDVRLAAAQFGEAFFTYDHEDVDASTDAVLGLVTDQYARAFEEQRLPGVAELFANTQLSTAGTAEEVFLAEVADDRARASVVLDVLATGQLEERTLDGLTLVLELQRVDGRWLVDAVTLPQTRVLGADGEPVGAATTATTAPPG